MSIKIGRELVSFLRLADDIAPLASNEYYL